MKSTLYYGDNLSILKGRDSHDDMFFPSESIDLVYLDPPFNSKRNYNMLFRDDRGIEAPSQIKAFEDFWKWPHAVDTYNETIRDSFTPDRVRRTLESLHDILGTSEMMAYVAMMAPRLMQLHRVLKPTGSIYLHCDPAASHYLKIIMDTVFGPTNFRNEIIWRRTGSHNSPKRYGPTHDVILFYSKTDAYWFRKSFRPYLQGHVNDYFKKSDAKGRFWTNALTGDGTRNGLSGQPWRHYNPTTVGRHWAIPGRIAEALGLDPTLTPQEKLDRLDSAGFISHPVAETSKAMPTYLQYLTDSPGMPLQDLWTYQPHTRGMLYNTDEGIDEDVRWLVAQGDVERLGYQTQKPLGLLRRIISSSCPPEGVVLDPFCGCGTAVDAAQELGRKWIGVDITHLAVNLIKNRLLTGHGLEPEKDYRVIGEPRDEGSAAALAEQDKEQFEYWALSLVEARPWEGKQKKGADKGRDGIIVFFDDDSEKAKRAVVSVKGGKNIGVKDIRELSDVVRDNKAELGIFISLSQLTKPMVVWAAEAGEYIPDSANPLLSKPVHRIQLFTVADLLSGKKPEIPGGQSSRITLRRTQRAQGPKAFQISLEPAISDEEDDVE